MVVEEDCLYATDWRLMRIVLHDFDSGQDVSLIADHIGGDSMSLRAPPQVVEQSSLDVPLIDRMCCLQVCPQRTVCTTGAQLTG